MIALAVSASAFAQGKSNTRGNGGNASSDNGNGNGAANSHRSEAPSSSPLPVAASAPLVVSSTPIAWLDDASVLSAGSMTLTVSAIRWMGTDLTEIDAPVVEASVGLAPRVQIGATVPHVVGNSDGSGPPAGMGTSYFSAKIAILNGDSMVKLAASPMIQVLGEAAAQLSANQGRAKFGLPINAELSEGPLRIVASTGFFSSDVWFAGGGLSIQVMPRFGVSAAFTRSWLNDDTNGISRDRREASGGASLFLKPQIAVFGSVARTIGTADDSGAGTTVSGGVTFLINRAPASH